MFLPLFFGIDDILFMTLALAATTGTASVVSGINAQKQQKKATAIQREADNLRAAREKRDAIRQGMIARATSEQNANNQGVAGGSSQGGLGSITSQANSNVHWLDTQQTANKMAGNFMDKAAAASSRAAAFGAVSNMAMSFAAGGYGQKPPADPNAVAPQI
jgi:hypothetical protein